MQAKLPDVNTALIRHRNASIDANKNYEYANAIIAISAMNALLPEDYKVEVNTEKYNQLVAEKKTIACTGCTATPLLKDISLHKLLLPVISQFVSNIEYINVWFCTECKEQNIYDNEQIKITKFVEPVYFNVMPSPPVKHGMKNRKTFESDFKRWFSIAIDELESQIGHYRADYAAQADSGMPEIKDSDVTG